MYAPSAASTFVPGELIGSKYRAIRFLGAGGMGIVFEAEHELTAKRVAIKRLRPQLAEHPEHVQRMLREAQASARIAHENVVDIYDVGADGDIVFLVMEYLEGETLGALLTRGPLSPHDALEVLIPAMRGVIEAHALGIVHRDIKPDNIFLTRTSDGGCVPKVLDFGISKLPREAEHVTLTSSGMTLGTPLYMAYEQLTGCRDVDARADVYAFGVILYEALTGATPFRADSLGSLAVQLATTTPRRASSLNAELPLELDAVLARALARDRDARYPSLSALVMALSPFASLRGQAVSQARLAARRERALAETLGLTSREADARPAQARSVPRRWLWAGVAVALIGATALLVRSEGVDPSAVSHEHAEATAPRERAVSPSAAVKSQSTEVESPHDAGVNAPSRPPQRVRSAKRDQVGRPIRAAEAAPVATDAADGAREPVASPASPRLRAGRPTLDQF